jgi:hypothetical protein
MSESVVEIRWQPEGDGTGKLTVLASANDYSGRASAWFDAASVAQFAELLEGFPLPSTEPIELASGFTDQEQIGIRVGPVGVKGQISVAVHLATPRWPDTRAESVQDVRLEVLTTYEHVGRFAGELAAVVRGEQDSTRIRGETLR